MELWKYAIKYASALTFSPSLGSRYPNRAGRSSKFSVLLSNEYWKMEKVSLILIQDIKHRLVHHHTGWIRSVFKVFLTNGGIKPGQKKQ